jgi:succinate dehydrogenase/fumarate reductase flavoprotein subunit
MGDWNREIDVAIVGMGLAGCVTAIEAHDASPGAEITIFEKAPETHAGGNSRVSGQALWIARPDQLEAVKAYQRKLNHPNPPPDAVLHTWADALVHLEPWIKAKASEVGGNYIEEMGYSDLKTIVEFPELGAEEAVAFNGTIQPNPSGVWRTFRDHVLKRPAISVEYDCPARELIQDEHGAVIGLTVSVRGKQERIRTRRGVVLSCGGFEANASMHKDHWGAEDIVALGTPYNTGDGIRMLQKVGARLWHMRSHTQSGGNWPAFKIPGFKSGFLRNVVMPDNGWFEIGADHKRFYDEGYHHRLRHFHVEEHGKWTDAPHWRVQPIHMIMDQKTLSAGPLTTSLMSWNPVVEGYAWSRDNRIEVEKGWITKSNSIEDLAAAMNRPVDAVEVALRDYQSIAKSESACPFGRGRETLRSLAGPPYYSIEIVPGIICSTGGGARDEKARVLDWDNQPIPGLYEAGELGSTFGNLYQNGAFLTEAMIFGRIAGREVIAHDI